MPIKQLKYLLIIFFIFFIFWIVDKKIIKGPNNSANIEHYQGLMTDNFIKQLESQHFKVDKITKNITYYSNTDTNTDTNTNTDTDINGETIHYNLHFNTNTAILTAKNKIQTSKALEKNGIPIPKFMEILDLNESANSIEKQMNDKGIYYPIVLKPIDGTFGIDVITDIDNINELSDTLHYFQNKNTNKTKNIMLEEQINAENCYRIFVFNNKIIDVVKREKPYITGDGKKTIKELIEQRNNEQTNMKLPITANVNELFIKKQLDGVGRDTRGNGMDSILPKNKTISISNVINMHNGARISRIPLEKVSKKNQEMFLLTNKAIDITCSGIDYLSNDISVDYDKNGGKVLEINGTPDTEIHTTNILSNSNDIEMFYNNIILGIQQLFKNK